MTTHDADPGGPSRRRRRGGCPLLAAESDLDGYGLPVRHTMNRSGTPQVFRLHRRKQVTLGLIGVVMGIGFVALGISALVNPATYQTSRAGAACVVIAGPVVVWAGICAFRMGVQVRGGKLIIGNQLWTRTIRAGDIRRITLEPKAVNEAGIAHWVARVELAGGRSFWIHDFDCGPAKRPPIPELAAKVEEVRARSWG
jgi:hypothetical protein